MKKFSHASLATKLLIAVTVALIVLLGVATSIISNIVSKTYKQTVLDDIATNVSIAVKLAQSHANTIKQLQLQQIRTFLLMYEGNFSIDSRERMKIGDYNAPLLKKGEMVFNESTTTIRHMATTIGMDLTFFVYDNGAFRRILTTMDVEPSVYGKPLVINDALLAPLMRGEPVFYTLTLHGKRKISVVYPLKDVHNNVIGAIASATDLGGAIAALSDDFNLIHVGGKTGYIFVLAMEENSNPTFIIHPTLANTNAFDLKDAHGNSILKDVVEQKTGRTVYFLSTQNGKMEERVAIFQHIPELDWIVDASISMAEINSIANSVRLTMFIIILATIIIITLLMHYLIGKVVSVPLRKVNLRLKEMAAGDLATSLKVDSHDELGTLSENINHTVSELNDVLLLLKDAVTNVLDSAESVGTANDEMAKGALHQSESTISMSATIEDMGRSIQILTEQMGSTAAEVSGVKENAETGQAVLNNTVEEIVNLSQSVLKISKNMDELTTTFNKISEVLQTINGIADQTNLLALNAAIEAARAGDAGRGFAVVADEVRKLAEKTVSATQEISDTIHEIRRNIKYAADEMEIGVKLAQTGEESTQKLNLEISQILERIIKLSDQITYMADLLQKQSASNADVITHVQNVAGTATENTTLANNNITKVGTLKKLAHTLIQRISTFKLKE